MASDNDWEDDAESGITQGPEKALQREIAKSKLLKVERLQLRDKIGKLKEENQRLLKGNQALRERLKALALVKATESPPVSELAGKPNPLQAHVTQLTRISIALLFLVVGWLFYFFMTL